MQNENWRAVDGFPNYEVSDMGRVRSWMNTRGRPLPSPRLLKNSVIDPGYCVVNLRRDGKTHKCYVHRLVLHAFVGPCPPGHQCLHAPSNDKTDCRLANLRWGTQAENEQDKRAVGTYHHTPRRLTDQDVAELRSAHASGERQCDLAARFGVSRPYVSEICAGKARLLVS